MDEMRLDAFRLVPRGPARLDNYEHATPIPSPVGDFIVCLTVRMDEQPTPQMLRTATELATRFEKDRELLARMIFDEYAAVMRDRYGRDWLEECGVPEGLTQSEICTYLNPRHLSVHDDCNAAVYVGPDWDREHGLTYELTEHGWEKVD